MADVPELPLANVRVLDLTRALSGPFCTAILGDLGADVVKVEPVPTGDMSRVWGPFDGQESTYYLAANRNKRSIALDFRSPKSLEILRRMALASDVLVENFKPKTMAKLGLDPDTLRAENPSLIVASISGFGSSGPSHDRPGFDQIAQGQAGFMSFTGTEESGPTRVGVAIGDMVSGLWLTIGILSAWISRQRHARGRAVETSLLSSLVGMLSVQGQRYLSLQEVPGLIGNAHPVIAPYGAFKASDGPMNICAATEEMWSRLCELIGLPDLKKDLRFASNTDRVARREELTNIINRALAARDRQTWTRKFLEANIPAGPINSVAEALEDEQVAHLGLVETVNHPVLGDVRLISNPIRITGNGGSWIHRSPPTLGRHTREVLREYGFGSDEITALEASGAIFDEASAPQQSVWRAS